MVLFNVFNLLAFFVFWFYMTLSWNEVYQSHHHHYHYPVTWLQSIYTQITPYTDVMYHYAQSTKQNTHRAPQHAKPTFSSCHCAMKHMHRRGIHMIAWAFSAILCNICLDCISSRIWPVCYKWVCYTYLLKTTSCTLFLSQLSTTVGTRLLPSALLVMCVIG